MIKLEKDNEDTEQESKPYTYIHQVITRNIHHYYLSTMIGDAQAYAEMVNKIQIAGPDDIIYIHLNTIGGYTSTGLQIINAMKTTPAHVICSIESEVSSLGTLIFLAADEFIVHDNCLMMFHNYSGAVWGKGHEQIAAIESAKIWTKDFLIRMYVPFMSEEEVNSLIAGADIYMHPPEIRERLDNMVKTIDKEAEERKKVTKKKVAKKKAVKKKSGTSKMTA